MSRIHKKNKSIKELIEKKDQLDTLKNAIMTIYMSSSEEELNLVIKKKLPKLCQMDSIELSPHQKKT